MNLTCRLLIVSLFFFTKTYAQSTSLWHGIQRVARYQPEDSDITITNGNKRFNRALYGTNTAFRVEAGDLPEFALYMPGMGGNMKFGIAVGNKSKWLNEAQTVKAIYRAGSMLYEVQDSMLGQGNLFVHVLPLANAEGVVVKISSKAINKQVQLFAIYGGATGTKFSRDGDIGADPESSFYLKPEYCKDNRFSIDKNSFTLSYGSKKPLTEEERYEIQHLPATTNQGDKNAMPAKMISGLFPASMKLKVADAAQQETPLKLFDSNSSNTPLLIGSAALQADSSYYFLLQNVNAIPQPTALDILFNEAETKRASLANRVQLHTPDPYINTLGPVLSVAADAIWESPSYMHGAVAWRMRLPAWRGAYLADVLGWHDRARSHFSSYALSQVTAPLSAPVVMDTALHLARHAEVMNTAMFSSGYISRNPGGDKRPHHYDMNLVFVDQLLNHFAWTGDTPYVKQMWPLLKRHLAWEKRNFDSDNDGLYDAYAAIWASDALQYSGGGVTHSSAYNYRAFKVASELAPLVGEDPTPYQKEAAKILAAINKYLWLPSKGWYAEYKDKLGHQLQHPSPGVWTIYHAIDSKITNAFQSYLSLNYITNNIPHIPIQAKGLSDTSLYTIATTNWQPYTWSLNNVALAEIMHTALAYWQGNQSEQAFKLWKSSLVESMFLSSSPGNIQQLSFYDAIRGELYRDFADPIGMTARSLVEGLFGVVPDALHHKLQIQPGLPADWKFASVQTPDFFFDFKGDEGEDRYTISQNIVHIGHAVFRFKARKDIVESIKINGKTYAWKNVYNAIGQPIVEVSVPAQKDYSIVIKWNGKELDEPSYTNTHVLGNTFKLTTTKASILRLSDVTGAAKKINVSKNWLTAQLATEEKHVSIFVLLKQGNFQWWAPVNISLVKPMDLEESDAAGIRSIEIKSNLSRTIKAQLYLKGENAFTTTVELSPKASTHIALNRLPFVSGTNIISVKDGNRLLAEEAIIDWDVTNSEMTNYEKINLTGLFNDHVTNIFKNQYFSPRPIGPTLQLPTQGIGNWCYPLTMAPINDSGLRKRAVSDQIMLQQNIPFATPSAMDKKNIAFTSMWDTYPNSIILPLSGKSSHVYFLLAGTTNPMQSRMINGSIVVQYKDGSTETLSLKNPENWWPIEQDYFVDGFAFTTDSPKPPRVYIKTGEDTRTFNHYTTIKGFSNRAIDGGAATVLDLPLNPAKELKGLVLKTIANDVVIGLMAVTLVR